MKKESIIQLISEKLSDSANVKAVFGDPVETQGKTIIPVAKFKYGFGAGGVNGTETSEKVPGGGGGGVSAKPAGVLEVTGEETRFVHFEDWKDKVQYIGVGFIIGMILFKWIR